MQEKQGIAFQDLQSMANHVLVQRNKGEEHSFMDLEEAVVKEESTGENEVPSRVIFIG